jgi:hypothetical protein
MVIPRLDAWDAHTGVAEYRGVSDVVPGCHCFATPQYSSVGVNAVLPVAGASLSSLNTLCQAHNNVQKSVRIAASLENIFT